MGPKTGIQLYDQSLVPLFLMGRMACMIRGPKSLAGLMAQPVGPPNPSPTHNTSNATGKASNAPNELAGFTIKSTPMMKTKVASVYVSKF